MAADSDRRDLHAALEQALGDRPATILMELLPPQGYADLVSRDQLGAFQAEVRGEFKAVRGEIAELRGELGEVRGEIAELRGVVAGQVGRFLAAAIPLMFGFAGLVLAAVKLA